MCNVTILTPMRDAGQGFEAYRARLQSLRHPYAALRVVLIEGDSVDDTAVRAREWAAQDNRVSVVTCNTGKPRYGSVVNADRFEGLAQVFNAGLDAIDQEWSTHVLMLPCDIEYKPDLLGRLLADGVDMVSPIVWRAGIFYDTFAFSRNGQHWPNFSQDRLGHYADNTLTEMDSIGGVLLMCVEVVQAGCRYSSIDVDRGLCREATERGFRVWADPRLSVFHPVS